ncbi:MAG TPA: hypothetical protein VH985_12410 [Candidatus Binatia bacterium]
MAWKFSTEFQFDVKCHAIDVGLLATLQCVQLQISNRQPAAAFGQLGMSILCVINFPL